MHVRYAAWHRPDLSMLGFRAFEIVDVIARSGTLSRAAELLDMTQPALTKALSSLELDIGAKLFERRAAGMEPTPFADVFIRRWQDIRRDLHDMRNEIDRIRGADEGVLRVATGYLAASSAEIALGSLTSKFPGLRIDSRQVPWSEVADAVRRGDADIGVADPADAENDTDLQVDFLVDRQAYFICRGQHPILQMENPDLDDILSYPFALNLIPKRMAQFFPIDLGSLGFRRTATGHLVPPIAVQSISAIRNILMGSDAISIMPVGSFVGLFQAGHLARIEKYRPPWLITRLSFITRARSVPTPAMQAFMDEVRRIELDAPRAILPE